MAIISAPFFAMKDIISQKKYNKNRYVNHLNINDMIRYRYAITERWVFKKID